ncbi:hypothetical protein V6N13_024194 [Hibiscus sabdariffa]
MGTSQASTRTISLFVRNIPPALHWSGLRQVFGRHGDITDQFIAGKLDRAGKRFGFVRFSNWTDANRAIERLNGFSLFGHRLSVSVARYGGGEDQLTGESTSQVSDRLQAWGLSEVTVKYIGGCKFLIDIRDQELFNQLKIQDWALLKEVFCEVEPWFELFHLSERITWIQVSGIPLHCWNSITLKRNAEAWGSLISLGENASQTFDCEKVSLLISTKQRGRINEVIEVEADRDVFLVQVYELGLNLDPKQHSTPLQATKNVEISSDSSSGLVESTASIKETHINCHEEDEVAKAICLERDPSIEVLSWNNERRNLGEEDLAGIANSAELSKHFNLGAVSPPRDCNATTANSLGRAVEDLNHMGFHNSQLLQISQSENDDQDISNEQIQDGPPNWVEQVDILNNSVIANPPSVESTLHPFHPWTSLNFPLEHHPKTKNDMVPLQRFKANI